MCVSPCAVWSALPLPCVHVRVQVFQYFLKSQHPSGPSPYYYNNYNPYYYPQPQPTDAQCAAPLPGACTGVPWRLGAAGMSQEEGGAGTHSPPSSPLHVCGHRAHSPAPPPLLPAARMLRRVWQVCMCTRAAWCPTPARRPTSTSPPTRTATTTRALPRAAPQAPPLFSLLPKCHLVCRRALLSRTHTTTAHMSMSAPVSLSPRVCRVCNSAPAVTIRARPYYYIASLYGAENFRPSPECGGSYNGSVLPFDPRFVCVSFYVCPQAAPP